jgi:hypothetical protein
MKPGSEDDREQTGKFKNATGYSIQATTNEMHLKSNSHNKRLSWINESFAPCLCGLGAAASICTTQYPPPSKFPLPSYHRERQCSKRKPCSLFQPRHATSAKETFNTLHRSNHLDRESTLQHVYERVRLGLLTYRGTFQGITSWSLDLSHVSDRKTDLRESHDSLEQDLVLAMSTTGQARTSSPLRCATFPFPTLSRKRAR